MLTLRLTASKTVQKAVHLAIVSLTGLKQHGFARLAGRSSPICQYSREVSMKGVKLHLSVITRAFTRPLTLATLRYALQALLMLAGGFICRSRLVFCLANAIL